MRADWFKNCKTKEDREARKKELLSYKNAFNELRRVLETLKEEPNSNYEKVDWALQMADIQGANRKLKQVLSLLDLKE